MSLAQAEAGLRRNGPAAAPPAPAPTPPAWRAPDDYAEGVRTMGVKALRAEAKLRGVDIRACVEKSEIVRALEDNASASRADDAEEAD